MSNRILKLKLFKENNLCHWCKKPMVLTNQSKGRLPENACTIDHVISRYSIYRWLKKKRNVKRRVLACFKCNHERSVQETRCLSREEILKRSNGYSLSPHGNPKIIKPLPTIKAVLDKLNIVDNIMI